MTAKSPGRTGRARNSAWRCPEKTLATFRASFLFFCMACAVALSSWRAGDPAREGVDDTVSLSSCRTVVSGGAWNWKICPHGADVSSWADPALVWAGCSWPKIECAFSTGLGDTVAGREAIAYCAARACAAKILALGTVKGSARAVSQRTPARLSLGTRCLDRRAAVDRQFAKYAYHLATVGDEYRQFFPILTVDSKASGALRSE